MTYSLKDNSKYKEWFEGNDSVSFDNCLLNRGDFGAFLADYLVGEKEGFVLNIDSPWGSGKTEFLKRMYVELVNRKHPCVYIDAWESDFSEAPLKVVASELVYQLELFHTNIGKLEGVNKLKEGFSKFLKASAILSTGVVSEFLKSSGMSIDSSMLTEAIMSASGASDSTELQKLLTDHQEQIQAIKTIRESLSQLAETLANVRGLNVPVVVLIDELDRCRPNYSVELLEVVKHFFATKNLVFVVASDTEQLESSIKVLYGESFDSKKYLKRFFDRVATLPEPNLGDYIKAKDLNSLYEDNRSVHCYPLIKGFKHNGLTLYELSFLWCALSYGLDIRDIDQVIEKVKACIKVLNARSQGRMVFVNMIVLVSAVCEHHLTLASYANRLSVRSEGREYVRPTGITLVKELDDIYEMSLDMVMKHLKPNYNGALVEKLVSRLNLYGYREFNEDISTLTERILSEYEEVIGIPRENKFFMLWDDYKQLIDLAGYIS